MPLHNIKTSHDIDICILSAKEKDWFQTLVDEGRTVERTHFVLNHNPQLSQEDNKDSKPVYEELSILKELVANPWNEEAVKDWLCRVIPYSFKEIVENLNTEPDSWEIPEWEKRQEKNINNKAEVDNSEIKQVFKKGPIPKCGINFND